MRQEADRAKLERFMSLLGERVTSEGNVYLTRGATALLFNWRASTVDVDIKADPEPRGMFEAIASLKEELDLNVELASPDQFIPPSASWRERSIQIGRYGQITFFHYDPYGQALSKLQRGHARDLHDVRSMLRDRLIDLTTLRQRFAEIEPQLTRYPAIDAPTFRAAVMDFCDGSQTGRE